MDSILQNEKICFLTGATDNLDEHHIFHGTADRALSEKYGLKVWLRHDRHIANSPYPTPHNNRELDLALKKVGKEAFEKNYPDLDFREVFGRDIPEA